MLLFWLEDLGKMKKEWILDNTVTNEKSLIKRLLISRGIKTEEEMKVFLNPLETPLTSPNVFTVTREYSMVSAILDLQASAVKFLTHSNCPFLSE